MPIRTHFDIMLGTYRRYATQQIVLTVTNAGS